MWQTTCVMCNSSDITTISPAMVTMVVMKLIMIMLVMMLLLLMMMMMCHVWFRNRAALRLNLEARGLHGPRRSIMIIITSSSSSSGVILIIVIIISDLYSTDEISGWFPVDLGIPPLEIKNPTESNHRWNRNPRPRPQTLVNWCF